MGRLEGKRKPYSHNTNIIIIQYHTEIQSYIHSLGRAALVKQDYGERVIY